MGGITRGYFLRRLAIFFLTIWIAATVIWIIPRLAPGDPVTAMVARMIRQAGYVENSQAIIDGWKERFGLNDPLPIQYVRYLGNLVRFDFGYSLAYFPTTVSEIVGTALPWTLGLLLIATAITFSHRQLPGRAAGVAKNAQAGKILNPRWHDIYVAAIHPGSAFSALHFRLHPRLVPADGRL
jgi:ABC-type dipeptide/oligopeptide/nickel transport system permease component